MRPVDLDKERLSGQVDDLPPPSHGNRPPAGTLWPRGEISLVGLIKLHVLPTDRQSLRTMLLERDSFPHKAGGQMRRPLTQGSPCSWFVDCSLERKHTNLGLLQPSLSHNRFCFPRKAAAVCIDWLHVKPAHSLAYAANASFSFVLLTFRLEIVSWPHPARQNFLFSPQSVYEFRK